MKKVLSVLLTLAMIFSLIPMGTFTLTASALTEGYYTYTVTDGKATITDVDTSISGDVTIPSTLGGYTVTSIDDSAFYNCTKLKGITIPASVTSIGGCMFSHTALTSIVVDSNNPKYHSAGNCIIDTENKVLIAGCKNSVIPNDGSVTSIGYSAFYENTDLTSITIPNSVTSIEWFAFDGCTNLTSITFSDNLISIGRCAFGRCEGLIDITIPNKVKSIGDFAFNNCKSLARITFSNTVTSIGKMAFYDCTRLSSVLYSGSEEDKGKINISSDNECLTSATWQYGIGFDKKFYTYTITDGKATITNVDTSISGDVTIPSTLGGYTVTSIGSYAFKNCDEITGIIIPDSVTSIGYGAFMDCTGLEVIIIPDGVTSIGSSAFFRCSNLTSINIPDGVTSIGTRTFYNCAGLTSIIVPDSVTVIGEAAFEGCYSIKKITLPFVGEYEEEYAPYSQLSRLFYVAPDMEWDDGTDDDPSLYVPSTLKEVVITKATIIGREAFKNCSNITNITIPNTVTSIYSSAFSGCTGLTDVWYSGTEEDKENISFADGNDYLLNATWHYDNTKYYTYTVTGGKATITAVDTSISGDVIIPSTLGGYPVTSIGTRAFFWCEDVTSVTIPDEVTSIDEGAFDCCTNVQSITIPDSVTSIGERAFAWCENLTSITIPDGVTSIGESMFYCCSKLESITIPNGVTSIGRDAFAGCASITSITVPDGVTTISEYAFFDCQAMTSITLPDSITSIGRHAFLDTGYYLNEDNWEDNVLYIGKHLIKANSLISGEYTVKEGTLTIVVYAFACQEELTGITLPESVKNIGEGAFEECISLANVCYSGSKEDRENINFADGNDCLLYATWYYNVCTDGHTYSYFYDSWCNKCSWSRGDREPTTLHALEMQQNMLGITTLPYGHFDINFDKKVDSTDLAIIQALILGL